MANGDEAIVIHDKLLGVMRENLRDEVTLAFHAELELDAAKVKLNEMVGAGLAVRNELAGYGWYSLTAKGLKLQDRVFGHG